MAKQKQENNNSHEEKYFEAIDVQEIAKNLIAGNTFVFPKNIQILYVFVEKMTDKWGKCSKCSDIMHMASGYDFVITINHTQWLLLAEKQRESLVFHELLHIGWDSEKETYHTVPHDLEEFSSVVKKYGLWRDSVTTFTNVAVEALENSKE